MRVSAVHGATPFAVACHPVVCNSTVVASHPCALQTRNLRP